MDYSDATIRHANESDVVLEFLDFYKAGNPPDSNLKHLIFDSKFTPYKNLRELDEKGVKFITIQRRGKTIASQLEKIEKSQWKKILVMGSDGKGRLLKIHEEK